MMEWSPSVLPLVHVSLNRALSVIIQEIVFQGKASAEIRGVAIGERHLRLAWPKALSGHSDIPVRPLIGENHNMCHGLLLDR